MSFGACSDELIFAASSLYSHIQEYIGEPLYIICNNENNDNAWFFWWCFKCLNLRIREITHPLKEGTSSCGYRGCYRKRCGAAGSGRDKKNHFILAIWKLLFSSFIHIMVSSWYVAGSIRQVYFVRVLAECLLPYFPSSRKKSGSFRRRAYVYCGDQRTHLRVQNVDRLLVLALFGFLEGWQPDSRALFLICIWDSERKSCSRAPLIFIFRQAGQCWGMDFHYWSMITSQNSCYFPSIYFHSPCHEPFLFFFASRAICKKIFRSENQS